MIPTPGIEARRTIMIAIALLCLGSCDSVPAGPPQLAPAILDPAEVNVRAFGARGDGQTDDTGAFNAALTAIGTSERVLYVPDGIYILEPTGGSPRGGLELSRPLKLTIRGDGMTRTTLRMAPGVYQGDTHLLFLEESSGITLRDLALDGNRASASFADEQNHCVEISRSSDIRFERVRFHNCRGDGIRLIAPPASDARWTERVTVQSSRFEDNGRSGIAVQRGVRNLMILKNLFERISDQSIDVEPTGSRAPSDILIEDNIIRHSTGTWAVAIGGIGQSDVAHRLTFRNNRVENGAVSFGKTDELLIEGNTILADNKHSALRLAKNVTNVLVVGNEISGSGGGEDGLVEIISLNGVFPSHVTLQGNSITATGGQAGIYVRDAISDIRIVGNEIRGVGNAIGVDVTSIALLGTPHANFSILDNVVSDFSAGVRFSSRGDRFTNVEIRGNSIDHSQRPVTETIGILFDKTGPYQAFADVTPNEYGPGIEQAILVRAN